MLELQKRIESSRNQIRQLPGIDYNKEEQLQRLDTLRNQLVLKQQLIKKYKNTQFWGSQRMVLRILMRYFANNEQLVQRMADSYPMRRAAQLLIAAFYKSKNIAEERGLNDMTPERFRAFFRSFKTNLKQEIEGAKEELKKRK